MIIRIIGLAVVAGIVFMLATSSVGAQTPVRGTPTVRPTQRPLRPTPTPIVIIQKVIEYPPFLPQQQIPVVPEKAAPQQPVVVVQQLPPPAPTHGPVHFPLYQPYDYGCDCYPGQTVEIPPPLVARPVLAATPAPQPVVTFKPPATGNGGMR